jgi:hypothetical protein
MHICDKCGKNFNYAYQLKKHQNKKFPCDNIKNIESRTNKNISSIEEEIKTKTEKSLESLICMFCNKVQTNKSNAVKHIDKFCKKKRELVENIDRIENDKLKICYKIKDKENKALKLALNSKLTTHNITINNINNINPTINNSTINNTQNNIIVVNPFGKEDLSHITIDDYKKYLNGFFPGFIKFIEKVHFDDNAPQNKNISITNLRSKYLSIHDGDRWLTQDKNDVIDNLLIKKHNILSGICEELEETDKIDKTTIDNFEEFCQNYNDADAKKNTRENVIMMIYDKINGDKDIKPKKKLKK